jgi:hypothetical protein
MHIAQGDGNRLVIDPPQGLLGIHSEATRQGGPCAEPLTDDPKRRGAIRVLVPI